jgi:class I fructose-bisphosphate aldolase
MAITSSASGIDRIESILGEEAEGLLGHECTTIARDRLHLPGPDFVDRVMRDTDRSAPVLRSLQSIFSHGRLGGTGYVSILPVDQGIEHSAGASFAKNPDYFDPEGIVKLALEGGCNAVASTLGVLGAVSRKYAHRIPFVVKLNHNEFLSYPNGYDQIMFGQVRQARELGAVAVGATIYFGSEESKRQIVEVSRAFAEAHEQGLATILWCYLRNSAFNRSKDGGEDYHTAADLTGQANHLGVTIEADIIKQKLPEVSAPGFTDLNFGKTDKLVYSDLTTPHPIDMTRYQLANCYMGRAGLINSGGASGATDLQDAVRTAVINKRAGGTGLISGRKAFQKPLVDGIELLNAIQDVYLSPQVTIA